VKKSKFQNYLIICLFLIILFFPVININKISGKISENEKRYLASFPKVFNQNGNLNVYGLKSGFENWLSDNIGFRENLVKLSADINFYLLHRSPSSKVEIGEGGWYFYTLDNNLDIAKGKYPLTDEVLLKIKNKQEMIHKKLKNKGIQYVLVLAPSKVSIYPEYIRSGYYKVGETPIDILTEYLEKNTDIKVINLKEALLEGKKNEQVYFKTDTHWNEAGAYYGYQSLINQLKSFKLTNTEPVEVKKIASTYKGEFSAMMGDINLLDEEACINTEIISPKSEGMDKISIGHVNPNYAYINNFVEENKVLMYGDSMFGSWNLANLLSENFSDFTYIWSYEMQQETIDVYKPNIVIYEITERYINNLANFNGIFISSDMKNPQAEIVSENMPTIIERGKKYNVDIIVKNTSQEAWTEDNMIRLCIWQDGIDYGYRIKIPDGVEINPSEEYTFVLQDFQAPPSNSTYIEFQMLQEGRTYFGEKQRVDISVKE